MPRRRSTSRSRSGRPSSRSRSTRRPGPVLDAATLSAIVAAARAHALPVVAHARAPGWRAPRSTPESTRSRTRRSPSCSTMPSISRAAAAGQRWISTLDIHRDDATSRETPRRTSTALRSARAARCSTAPTSATATCRSASTRASSTALHARGPARRGPAGDASPTRGRARSARTASRTFVPGDPPADLDAVPAWLAGATVVPTEELIHDDHG